MKLALCTGTLDRDGTQGERQEKDNEVFYELASEGLLHAVQLYITPGTKPEHLGIFKKLKKGLDDKGIGLDYIIHAAHVGSGANFPDPLLVEHNLQCVEEAKNAFNELDGAFVLYHPGGTPKIDIKNNRYEPSAAGLKIGEEFFKEITEDMLKDFDPRKILFENEPYEDFNREILFARAHDLTDKFPFLGKTGICYDAVHAYVSAVHIIAGYLRGKGKLNPEFDEAVYDPSVNGKANLEEYLIDKSEIDEIKDDVMEKFKEFHSEFLKRRPEVIQLGGTPQLALIDQDGDIFGPVGIFIRESVMDMIEKDFHYRKKPPFIVYEAHDTAKGRDLIRKLHAE